MKRGCRDVCGTVTSTYEDGRVEVRVLRKCVHCGYMWEVKPGSGIRRGFCCNCMGHVCGRPYCIALGCTCEERLLDNMEAGRPLDFRPVFVANPGIVLG